MAEEQLPKRPATNVDDEWQPVTSHWQRGDALKDGPYATLSRNGALLGTVEATARLERAAAARGLARHHYVLVFRANVKKGQVGCIPTAVADAEQGAAGIRWYEGKGSARAAFHIGGVFKDHPTLALKSDVRCTVNIATAPDGLPMLVIPIQAALDRTTSTRGGQAE